MSVFKTMTLSCLSVFLIHCGALDIVLIQDRFFLHFFVKVNHEDIRAISQSQSRISWLSSWSTLIRCRNKKSPHIVGLRRNATCSKCEMFTNRKPTHDFVLTLNTKFCSISHRLADIWWQLWPPKLCAILLGVTTKTFTNWKSHDFPIF